MFAASLFLLYYECYQQLLLVMLICLVLVLSLLLIGLSLSCVVWVRKAQRQAALDRQLIAMLEEGETNKALVLVEAGANPNTRREPMPSSFLLGLLNKLMSRSPVPSKSSPTAFMLACKNFYVHQQNQVWYQTANLNLTQGMLLRGAEIDAKDENGWTALNYVVSGNPNKEVI